MTNLDNARINKKDEFYTSLEDISLEIPHYKNHLKNKIILCNCDNPTSSAFLEYFHTNFKSLKLKKLIATYYDTSHPVYKAEYFGGDDNNILSYHKTRLKDNGDFRNIECINILKTADIIITNPPFSLFRDYIDILIKYNKNFLIIGNQNAITYKKIFPLIKNNLIWYGVSIHSDDRKFFVPDDYPFYSNSCGIENGKRYIKIKGVRWFTNLDYPDRHKNLNKTLFT